MMQTDNMRRDTIKVRDLVTGYDCGRAGVRRVSKAFDATLRGGELTCLLGPNGAGKSTLLRTLAAFQPAIGGVVEVEGRPLDSYSRQQLSRLISVVLTERVSLDNMTVEELVGLGRSPYTGFWGRLSAHDYEVVGQAIGLVGIDDLRNRQVHTLSDGERQKVMIAKALAQETPIIFLDEPSAFLDYPSKVEIMQLLQRLAREEGKTVFLSTHDLELALQIADMVWLIDKSLGVRVGTPEDLALDGEIGRYFEREGVVFDMETGLFRIDNRLDISIRLTGHGPRRNMARKALARCGVYAGEDAGSAEHLIEVTDSAYTLDGHEYGTIAALLTAVAATV